MRCVDAARLAHDDESSAPGATACSATTSSATTCSATACRAAVHRLRQFVDRHPTPLTADTQRHVIDMLASVNNRRLDEHWNTAARRYWLT